jgi:hypothetical protein
LELKLTGAQLTFWGSWTAVCRGAVIHAASVNGLSAFPIHVQARISRASCGIKVYENWDDQKHALADKVWNDDWQCWETDNQMEWFLQIVRFIFQSWWRSVNGGWASTNEA